jgi:uracil-DNA glycosylase family 4
MSIDSILNDISKCVVCQNNLPYKPKPVVTANINSRIIIIGQAPGIKVQNSGIPWDDKSGENLRSWMGIDSNTFYDTNKIGIIPMGFCYPGKGKTGDLPPRKECAPLWHQQLFNELKNVKLILLVGKYAQDYYLKKDAKKNLTETVMHFENYLPNYFVLPHPSPRNNIWQAKNPWFNEIVVSELQAKVKETLS